MPKIRFEAVPPLPREVLDGYKARNRSLGLPEIRPGKVGAAAPLLAVCGGAPSITRHIPTLRTWPGEVFAINGTWKYLADNGIDATFYTIDPEYMPPKGVKKAVVSDGVNHDMLQALLDGGAAVELIITSGEDIMNFSTSAATVPMFACWRGHKHVSFYGCDSSYGETTHADRDDAPNTDLIWVECGGKEYVTSAQMIMHAEDMHILKKTFPSYITISNDGFLGALIACGDYTVTHVSRRLADTLGIE